MSISDKEKDYRSIYLWGDPSFKDHHIEQHIDYFYSLFGEQPAPEKGEEQVELKLKSKLTKSRINALSKLVGGGKNVLTDDYSRAAFAYGKFYTDLIKLRQKKIDAAPDAVIRPRNEKDVIAVVKYCHDNKIAIIPSGARSSVCRGVEGINGGISLDLTAHLNKNISLNEINSSVTADAGVYGPQLEEYLNSKGFTCGHFPQSFEFSTIAGWVAAHGAGQASTGYGRMSDMTLSLRVVTPAGVIETRDFPGAAIGPDLNRVFVGSEGAFGVITSVTMKVRKYRPENSKHISVLFKDFESAVNAMRTMIQAGYGMPHLFRISDAEETDVAFNMKKMSGGFADKFLKLLGFKPMKRCLMFISIEGDKDYTKFVGSKIRKTARKHKGLHLGAYPTRKWLEQRYSSAYMRDPMMDAGIRIDTLETGVTWDTLMPVWQKTREYIKSFEQTSCLVHISHVYENGANLYFVFASPMSQKDELKDYEKFQSGVYDTITEAGGSLSHHHGIGRMLASRLKSHLGEEAYNLINGIKKHLDPNGIMNPGVFEMPAGRAATAGRKRKTTATRKKKA